MKLIKKNKIMNKKQIRDIVRNEIKYLVGCLVFGLIIVVLSVIVIWNIGLLIDSHNDIKICERNARTLIDESFFDLKCFANDNIEILFDNELNCSCFYQGEYPQIGFGTKQKDFILK